jgi:hypothetical protein
LNEAEAVVIESASSFSEGVRVRRLVEARLTQLCTQLVEWCKRVTRSGEQHSKVREWLTESRKLLIRRGSGIRGAASRT